MNITVRQYESQGIRCRHCKVKARWSVSRPNRWHDDRLCDQHLGLALRNLGLTRFEIAHEARVTATIMP